MEGMDNVFLRLIFFFLDGLEILDFLDDLEILDGLDFLEILEDFPGHREFFAKIRKKYELFPLLIKKSSFFMEWFALNAGGREERG